MFLLKNIIKRPFKNQFLPLLSRANSGRDIPQGAEPGACSYCGGALSDYEPAAVLTPAPDFKAKAWHKGNFKDISLCDYKGKYVVLFFYPADFTFVCPTEIIEFSKKSGQFRETNCEVIGCSVDSVYSHMEYDQKPKEEGGLGGLEIPLIGDLSKDVSDSFGVLVREGDNKGAAFRATFIIDTKGIIRHKSVNDLPVGRNVDEVLRLVKAFQFVDKHGEVCPSGWKPGEKGMVPEHESDKTKKYWKEVHGK